MHLFLSGHMEFVLCFYCWAVLMVKISIVMLGHVLTHFLSMADATTEVIWSCFPNRSDEMEETLCSVRVDHGCDDTLSPTLTVQKLISKFRTKRRGSVVLLLLAACCTAAVWCLGVKEYRQPLGVRDEITLSDAESRPHYQSAFHFQPPKNWMNGMEFGSIHSYNFLSNACLRKVVMIEAWNTTLQGFIILYITTCTMRKYMKWEAHTVVASTPNVDRYTAKNFLSHACFRIIVMIELWNTTLEGFKFVH